MVNRGSIALFRAGRLLKDGAGFAPAEIYEAFGVRRFAEPPRITHARC
jgi:hypothetical protein